MKLKVLIIEDEQSYYNDLKNSINHSSLGKFHLVDIGTTLQKKYDEYLKFIENQTDKPNIIIIDYHLEWHKRSSANNGKETIEEILSKYYANEVQPFLVYISLPKYIEIAKIALYNSINKGNVYALPKSDMWDKPDGSPFNLFEQVLLIAETYNVRLDPIKKIEYITYPKIIENTNDDIFNLKLALKEDRKIDTRLSITNKNFVGLICETDYGYNRHCVILFEDDTVSRYLIDLSRVGKPAVAAYLDMLGLNYENDTKLFYNPYYIELGDKKFTFRDEMLSILFKRTINNELSVFGGMKYHPYESTYREFSGIR